MVQVGFDGVALVVVDGPGLQVVLGHPEGFLDLEQPVAGADHELWRDPCALGAGLQVGDVALDPADTPCRAWLCHPKLGPGPAGARTIWPHGTPAGWARRLRYPEALNEVGKLHLARGDLAGAESWHRQALELAREIPSPWDEAHALAGQGRCALAAGRRTGARASLGQALAIFQRIGAAETDDVSAELDALAQADPPTGTS
jgi:hypothetical protein